MNKQCAFCNARHIRCRCLSPMNQVTTARLSGNRHLCLRHISSAVQVKSRVHQPVTIVDSDALRFGQRHGKWPPGTARAGVEDPSALVARLVGKMMHPCRCLLSTDIGCWMPLSCISVMKRQVRCVHLYHSIESHVYTYIQDYILSLIVY